MELCICDLSRRMDAGIGSARAVNLHRLSCNPGQQRFELALNRVVRISLLLPAVIARAIVLQDHFIIHLFLPSSVLFFLFLSNHFSPEMGFSEPFSSFQSGSLSFGIHAFLNQKASQRRTSRQICFKQHHFCSARKAVL